MVAHVRENWLRAFVAEHRQALQFACWVIIVALVLL